MQMSLRNTILRPGICARQLTILKSQAHAFSSTSRYRDEPEDASIVTTTRRSTRPVPPALPFVPDVKTFLTLIGRKSSEHVSKIPSWDALFTMTATELRLAGIEPPRLRKYICWWRERFRQGVYGIGGDFKHVRDGKGFLQVVEIDANGRLPKAQEHLPAALKTPGKKAIVVNVPEDQYAENASTSEVVPAAFVQWVPQYKKLQGSYLVSLPGHDGKRAQLEVREGLWEQKRGRKVDGGERRRAEVRAKRQAKENKDARAAAAAQ